MDLKFKQQELSFLYLYATCTDTKAPLADKFQILSIENSTDLVFIQCSSLVDLVTIVKNKNLNKEKIFLTYQSVQFSEILKHCSVDDEIIISNACIVFGKSSKYTFETYDFDPIINVDEVLSLIENKSKYKENSITGIEKISQIKSYLGNELTGLNIIGFFNNCFVVSNKEGTGIVKTNNQISSNYYFPAILHKIYLLLQTRTVKLYEINENSAFMFCHDNINILFSKPEEQVKLDEGRYDDLIFPNLLDPEIKKVYYHDFFVTFNKEEFLRIIKKISVVTNSEYEFRFFMTFLENKIVLEVRDINPCIEVIEYKVPKELYNVMLVLGVHFTINMITYISGDTVVIRVPKDEDNLTTVSFMDVNENVIFVQAIQEESCIIK